MTLNPSLLLVLAIICEVIATSTLKATSGFTRLLPTIAVIAGYLSSFYLLSLVLKEIPIGITYAIWSGVGIVLITLVGYAVYRQALDLPAIAGIALILAGVLVINLWSKSVVH
ncbi:MAG: multidrug efflux protein [Methanoregulaceae archaeon PtaB.Bin056]|jgi:small multidrug resistance pump|nr:MAG: multidrug efflux protein [Methanoregulaceae archaeon PtaB.Bin056]OPY42882.1 MAG: multidrug efflux protein [Methanoregulaceae archaeon PtaU1.Bin066]HNQ30344.1 SMR family transporter [Methanolinea sp.]